MIKTIMEVIGWTATIICLPSGFYFIISFIKNRKKISWRKARKAAKSLVKDIEIVNPDLIITFSGRGAIFANILLTELENKYPTYTCLLKNNYNDIYIRPKNWDSFTTTKWIVFVPDEIKNFTDKKILIVDDITRSGETIIKTIDYLVNYGAKTDKIFSMALMANQDVLSRIGIPQYYWKSTDNYEYKAPWEIDK